MPDFQGKILSQECGRYCRFLYLKMLNSDNIIYIYIFPLEKMRKSLLKENKNCKLSGLKLKTLNSNSFLTRKKIFKGTVVNRTWRVKVAENIQN